MVTRPVFLPNVNEVGVTVLASSPFRWNPGFAFVQKQKNVLALHDAICAMDSGLIPLEISSKSKCNIGVRLSAFNLGVESKGRFCCVESVFQASKVFAGEIGPFPELYWEAPSVVRAKIKEIGLPLVAFQTGGERWGLNPTRAFYDWVYCRALHHNADLACQLKEYNCFTDIEFNPVRSLNCQAYAVALYLSLQANDVLDEALSNKTEFLRHHPKEIVDLAQTNSGMQRDRIKRSRTAEQYELFAVDEEGWNKKDERHSQ